MKPMAFLRRIAVPVPVVVAMAVAVAVLIAGPAPASANNISLVVRPDRDDVMIFTRNGTRMDFREARPAAQFRGRSFAPLDRENDGYYPIILGSEKVWVSSMDFIVKGRETKGVVCPELGVAQPSIGGGLAGRGAGEGGPGRCDR